MTQRKILPYLLTITLFVICYVVTMVIPNDKLYLGLCKDWGEVKMNNKLPLQIYLFTYGLVLFVLAINAFEILISLKSNFLLRLAKSLLTVILIYLVNALVYKILDNKVWNLYWYPRGSPVNFYGLVTLILTAGGICVLEIINFIFFKLIKKEQIRKFLPVWSIEKEA